MDTITAARQSSHHGYGLFEIARRLQGFALMPKMVELSFSRVAILLGTFAGITTSIVVILNATSAAEPYWLAHREFVREQITKTSTRMAQDLGKVELRQISTQLQMAKTSRRDIQSKIEDKQLLVQQNPTLPSGVRDTINEQVKSLKEEYEEISETISNLQREQRGRP